MHNKAIPESFIGSDSKNAEKQFDSKDSVFLQAIEKCREGQDILHRGAVETHKTIEKLLNEVIDLRNDLDEVKSSNAEILSLIKDKLS